MTDTPERTDDLDLGPGLTVTPGHPVQPKPTRTPGPVFSDRVLDAHGNAADHPILSTYHGNVAGEPVTATEAENPAAPSSSAPEAPTSDRTSETA